MLIALIILGIWFLRYVILYWFIGEVIFGNTFTIFKKRTEDFTYLRGMHMNYLNNKKYRKNWSKMIKADMKARPWAYNK